MKREEVLRKAESLVHGDRQKEYGPPQRNFRDIAAGWSAILGTQVTPEQVCRCMAWLKIARLSKSASDDSCVDAAAYMALASELDDRER